ncbi:MAG TPA: hypothetical protein VK188_05315 [Holophaga sp.]|nr:hypothetical protein [Holophaga sp.]
MPASPLRLLPLASSFHSAEQVVATVEAIGRDLEARGIPHRPVTDPAEADALLVVTGGTEALALRAAEARPGPVLLVAHPSQNALPASLEILAHLRQAGRAGRIVLLNGKEEGYGQLRRAAGHLAARERLGRARLGRIGAPSDWLVASMPDPALVKAAWGPEVVDVSLAEVRDALAAADPAQVADRVRDFRSGASRVVEPSDRDLEMAARVTLALREVVARHRLDACSVRCFELVTDLGTTGCLGLSALLDDGIVAGCEGDIPAALTMLWMQALGTGPAFMANPQDLDAATGTLWLAHCTIARRLVKTYALRSHFESSLGVGLQGEVPPGPVTLARVGGADLRGLFVSDGELDENGDSELRCRTQVRVRLEEGLDSLLERPLGNHHVLVPGHWARAMREYHAFVVA